MKVVVGESRKFGGRVLLNIKTLHNHEIYNLREYFLHIDVTVLDSVVEVNTGFIPLAKKNKRYIWIYFTRSICEI